MAGLERKDTPRMPDPVVSRMDRGRQSPLDTALDSSS
jgi:hypothetical protein